VNLKRN